MEKSFQIDNVDLNAIHDRLVSELQNSGFEIYRDEPRDNGFKLFARRGEEHGEVEVFNDWGTVRLITHGRLEWELMNIAEPIVSSGAQTTPRPMQPAMQMPQQSPIPQPPRPPMQYPVQQPYPMPQQPMPQQQPQQQPTYYPQPSMPQIGGAEHTQLLNVLVQNGYQIEVNTVSGQIFFIRGRKGNYVIDIEGRPQP